MAAPYSAETEHYATEESRQRFEVIFKHQPILYDKGFDLVAPAIDPAVDTVRGLIQRRGWQAFCALKNLPATDLVQEFYSNLCSPDTTEVTVQGRPIPFTALAINQLYNLPDVEDEYSEILMIRNEQIDQLILQTLTVEGTQWDRSAKEGILTCKQQFLQPVAKLWFYFLRFSLMPTRHCSSITVERMYLLYTILSGREVNIGEVLAAEIKKCALTRIGSRTVLPTVVSDLCETHMAAPVPGRVLLHRQGRITDYDIRRILNLPHRAAADPVNADAGVEGAEPEGGVGPDAAGQQED